jgi:hypothetical protein
MEMKLKLPITSHYDGEKFDIHVYDKTAEYGLGEHIGTLNLGYEEGLNFINAINEIPRLANYLESYSNGSLERFIPNGFEKAVNKSIKKTKELY